MDSYSLSCLLVPPLMKFLTTSLATIWIQILCFLTIGIQICWYFNNNTMVTFHKQQMLNSSILLTHHGSLIGYTTQDYEGPFLLMICAINECMLASNLFLVYLFLQIHWAQSNAGLSCLYGQNMSTEEVVNWLSPKWQVQDHHMSPWPATLLLIPDAEDGGFNFKSSGISNSNLTSGRCSHSWLP
jgi:hypothetical protein